MILWSSQEHKLGNEDFENQSPRDRDGTRMSASCPVHFPQNWLQREKKQYVHKTIKTRNNSNEEFKPP